MFLKHSSILISCNAAVRIFILLFKKYSQWFTLLISAANLVRFLIWTKLWTVWLNLSLYCWTRGTLETEKAEADWDLGSDEPVMSSPVRTTCRATTSCRPPLCPPPPPTTQALFLAPTLHSAPSPVRTRGAESWNQTFSQLYEWWIRPEWTELLSTDSYNYFKWCNHIFFAEYSHCIWVQSMQCLKKWV